MMNTKLTALIAAAMLVLAATEAVATEGHEFDRFQLWTDCSPMDLAIEGLRADKTGFRLTLDAVETAVRSRLRVARLYNATKYAALLVVNVNIVPHEILWREAGKQPFNITFKYYKLMKDIMSGERNLAVAWDVSTAGIGDPSFILSAVSEKADMFIDEYLRVNQDSCGKR